MTRVQRPSRSTSDTGAATPSVAIPSGTTRVPISFSNPDPAGRIGDITAYSNNPDLVAFANILLNHVVLTPRPGTRTERRP